MFRLVCLALCACLWGPAVAQKGLFSTTRGQAAFTSNAPLEVIKASSDEVVGKLDPTKRIFAFKVAMQSFNGFNSALQRQHFNENYVESERYPHATFLGRIIEEVDLSQDGTYQVRAKGKLTIHGQTQERILPARVVVRGRQATIEATFEVPLTDHNISIPSIVNRKIAEVIAVRFLANLQAS